MPGFEITVSGRVQGVGFRYYCQSEALKLGVAGNVRNQRDKTVFLQAWHISQESLDEFLEQIKRGPGWVNHMAYAVWKPSTTPEGFEIEQTV